MLNLLKKIKAKNDKKKIFERFQNLYTNYKLYYGSNYNWIKLSDSLCKEKLYSNMDNSYNNRIELSLYSDHNFKKTMMSIIVDYKGNVTLKIQDEKTAYKVVQEIETILKDGLKKELEEKEKRNSTITKIEELFLKGIK